MKAAKWIDRVKAARGWDSDYRAAKELGLGRATISKYRALGGTLDEATALRVAEALGEDPAVPLAAVACACAGLGQLLHDTLLPPEHR